jgi:hypothetical protein
MYCTSCGQPLPDNSKFCQSCGAGQLPAGQQPVNQQPVNQPFAGQPPAGAPVPNWPQAPRRANIWPVVVIPVLVILVAAGLIWAEILPNPFNGRTQTTTTGKPQPTTTSTTAKPTTTAEETSTTTTAATQQTLDMTRQAILDYFSEIALKREYGGGEYDGVVCRWEQPIKVVISGSYTQDDYDWLTAHIDWLNNLGCLPVISVVTSGGNFEVHFAKLAELPDLIPGYVEGNWGFISLYWNDNGQITEGTMGIATDVTNQIQRNHLILEEFTQGLGLLNDSKLYQDSIFQMDWTEIQALSPLDELVIRLLYAPVVQAGMKDNVQDKLDAWLVTQGY